LTPSDSSTAEEKPERTKWLWLSVAGIMLVMVAAFWLAGPTKPAKSTVWARHILVKCNVLDPVERTRALERIKELKARLANGESFAKLAKKYSDDPYSAPRGGSLPPATKFTYEGAFGEYLWEGPVGEVSDAIQSQYGFHLVLIEDRYLTEVDAYLREANETSPPPSG